MNYLIYSSMIKLYLCLGDIDQINEESFFEKVVDTHCVQDETVVRSLNHFLHKYIILKIKVNYSSYQLLALELTRSSRRDAGGRTGDGWRRAGDTGMEEARHGRKKEARQSRRRRKGRREEARQGGRRKRGSAPRTKLKSRGCRKLCV